MRIKNYAGLLFLILIMTQLQNSTASQHQTTLIDQLKVIEINKPSSKDTLSQVIPTKLNKIDKYKAFKTAFRVVAETLRIKDLPHKKASSELHCLALNIYFESRSESKAGQRAVGHVVMNRLDHAMFPSSVCGVVKQGGEQRLNRCQFSWWCDGLSDQPGNLKAWKNAIHIAHAIYIGKSKDPTDGALWYHADYVSPSWQSALLQGPKIGRHIFYLDSNKLNS